MQYLKIYEDFVAEAKFLDSETFKKKDIQVVSTDEMRSGFMRSRNAVSFVDNFKRGQAVVELQPNVFYRADRVVRGNTLTKDMIVSASYNTYNQGIEFYEILGFSDTDIKYGEGGVKFDSIKDVFKHFNVKSLKELETLNGKGDRYGHGVYLWIQDLESKDSGPWFYLYNGRWSRGSGAEALSFLLLKEVHLLDEENVPTTESMSVLFAHDPNLIVGKTLQEAEEIVKNWNCSLRISKENGENLTVTMDYCGTRINVAVEDGIVTEFLEVG